MKTSIFFFFLLCILLICLRANTNSSLWLSENNHPGFIGLTEYDSVFYWLFKSRSNKIEDPLIIWLSGAGCSAVLPVFKGNGPYRINNDLSLSLNPYSWNTNSNVVYFEQPSDFYTYLVLFLEKFPEFKGKPIYIGGEAFSGHYVPDLSSYLHIRNNSDINIVGVLLENSWVNPSLQYPSDVEYAYESNLIGIIKYSLVKMAYIPCASLINSGNWPYAFITCSATTSQIVGLFSKNFNIYDKRQKCINSPICYDFSTIEKFLMRSDVILDLGFKGKNMWDTCKVKISDPIGADLGDMSSKITYLLNNNIFVFVYHGDQDFVYNWKGGEAWTKAVEWPYKQEFNDASYNDWKVDGVLAGEYKQVKNLVFLKVFNSGHIVAMDQPKVSLKILEKLLKRNMV